MIGSVGKIIGVLRRRLSGEREKSARRIVEALERRELQSLREEEIQRVGRGREQIFYNYLSDRELSRFYDIAMSCLWASKAGGDYHEYGIFGARTFTMALTAAYKYNLSSMNFFAFDSFEGLPTDGSLSMSEAEFMGAVREHGIYADRVTTVAGWYRETLTAELQRQFVDRNRPLSFVNIDCDLHESAECVFSFIEPLLENGSIVYIDDYFSTFRHGPDVWGTAKAFFEFRDRSRFTFYPFREVGFWGKAFIAYNW